MDRYERILRIFEELSSVKTAKAPSPGAQAVAKEYSEGKHGTETSRLLKDMYPTAVDVGDERSAKPAPAAYAATTDVAFPLEGEDVVSKSISDLTLDPKQYRKKLASMTDAELQQHFLEVTASLASEFIPTPQDIPQNDQQYVQQVTQNQVKTSSGSLLDDPDVRTGFVLGTIYSLQKQAEADADLVGSYLYSFANTVVSELIKTSQEEEEKETEEESDEEDLQRKSTEEETPEETVSPEEKDLLTEDEAQKIMESMLGKKKDKEEVAAEKEKETVEEESEDKEEAETGLDDLNKLSDEELIESLGQALSELGLTPDALKEAGPTGEKLASLYENYISTHKESGKQHKKAAAVNYMKRFIKELLHKSR